MFKKLAPVIELPESRSGSSSPVHKRSKTQPKTRCPSSPADSTSQVWMIIQSRRDLDKKMRTMHKNVKSTKEKPRPNSRSKLESPCNKSMKEPHDWKNDSFSIDKKKIELKNSIKLRKEKSKEIKEKIAVKAFKARYDIKLQSALDLEFIKKRDELLYQQKKEKVNSIKNDLKNAKHKRAVSNQALREISSMDYQNRLNKIVEINKNAENSLKLLEQKQEIALERMKSSCEFKENVLKVMPDRSLSDFSSKSNKF
ncbi:hypothetical protein SteCoe_6077 [Stentor coeruleus]|uniref:Uncharacterized protein n=1 Tax=Stentor coeruleus TaxID=5963 RepID=A0A1R2CQY5_9CILI|nr:hypothetical protein SteCoe_6077 [Stentor coeruleus]